MSPVRVLRIGGCCIFVASAVVGVLTAQVVVAVLAIAGAVVGGMCAMLGEQAGRTAGRPPRRMVDSITKAAVLGLVGVVAMAGLVVLTGAAALLIAAVWLGGAAWLRRRPSPAAPKLSDADLAIAWQRSGAELARARDAAELARVSALRQGQLDEMERRDPAGFRDWLGGPAWVTGDRARFLGG